MDAVRVLLEAGARVSAENNIGRTAAQLGAFVGKKKNVKTNFINLKSSWLTEGKTCTPEGGSNWVFLLQR